jgi:hypothetical protein
MVNRMNKGRVLAVTAAAVLTAGQAMGADDGFEAAYGSITRGDLAAHIKTLASDDFEGREPGTSGEV